MGFIKNIEHEKVLALTGEISVQKGQIVSKTLAQNEAVIRSNNKNSGDVSPLFFHIFFEFLFFVMDLTVERLQ